MLDNIPNSLQKIFKKHDVPTDNIDNLNDIIAKVQEAGGNFDIPELKGVDVEKVKHTLSQIPEAVEKIPSLRETINRTADAAGKVYDNITKSKESPAESTSQPSSPSSIFGDNKPISSTPIPDIKDDYKSDLSYLLNVAPAKMNFDGVNKANDNLQANLRQAKDHEASRDVLSMVKSARADAKKLALSDPAYEKYDSVLKSINEQIAANKQEGIDKENKTEWLQALETIGQAITQYAAARYGQEHNVNLGGLKMDKTDWDKMLARTQARLHQELENLQDFRKETSKNKQQILSDAQDMADMGVKTQIEGERKADELGIEGARAEVASEEKKANWNYQAAKENIDNQFRKAALEAQTGGVNSPSYKNLQKVVAQDVRIGYKIIEAKKKALGIVSNYVAQLEGNTSSKVRKSLMPKLKGALEEAGIDSGDVIRITGWFGSEKIDNDAFKKELVEQKALLGNDEDKLQSYQENAATAGTPKELIQIRNEYQGKVSAESAKTAGQSQPSSGTIKVKLKRAMGGYPAGHPGEIPAASFDPAIYDKVE